MIGKITVNTLIRIVESVGTVKTILWPDFSLGEPRGESSTCRTQIDRKINSIESYHASYQIYIKYQSASNEIMSKILILQYDTAWNIAPLTLYLVREPLTK